MMQTKMKYLLLVLVLVLVTAVTRTAEGQFAEPDVTGDQWILLRPGSDSWETTVLSDSTDVILQARWARDRQGFDFIEYRMRDPSKNWLLRHLRLWIALPGRENERFGDSHSSITSRAYDDGWDFLYIRRDRLDGYPIRERVHPRGEFARFYKSGEIVTAKFNTPGPEREQNVIAHFCGGTKLKDCPIRGRFYVEPASDYISYENLRQWLIDETEARQRWESMHAAQEQKLAGVRDSVLSLQTELSEVKEACDENAVRGDFNGDGRVNFADFLIFVGLYDANN